MTQPAYLSKSSLAATLEISETTVDEMVRRGVLPKPAYVEDDAEVWEWAEVDGKIQSLSRISTRAGLIYVVSCGPAYVKIGFTLGDIPYRIAALQTGAPERLEVIASMDGTMADERALHRRFAKYNTHGEWFRCEGELAEWLLELRR